MSDDAHMPHPRLIIFARYPAPGYAKTRLIPALGDAGAARLQDVLTRHTLQQAADLTGRRHIDVEVRCTGGPVAAMRERYGATFVYADQGDGDLGERLARAAADAARSGCPAVVIGTDCPGITAELLESAFDALANHDVVLGPALDGGYYLIGFRRFARELFENIPWSTPDVLALTCRASERAGLTCAKLGRLADVDVPEDLPACESQSFRQPLPYRPTRIAITGATGALGRQFLSYLLRELNDVHVTALVRTTSAAGWSHEFRGLLDEYGRRITLVEGDLTTLQFSAAAGRALCEADGGLWHFAASTMLHTPTPAAEARVEAVNDGGTARLLAAIAASDRPGPLYHLSTAYVCGLRAGTVAEHELDDAAGFRNVYERSKFAAEVRVRAALAAGLPGVIFRPSLVAPAKPAPGAADVVSALANGIAAAARNGRRLTLRMPPEAGVNAARAAWLNRAFLALAPYAASRRTYHLTARENITISDAAAAASRSAGLDVRCIPSADSKDLSSAERILDRMLRPFRPYFEADVQFDRRNLELDAPELSEGTCGSE